MDPNTNGTNQPPEQVASPAPAAATVPPEPSPVTPSAPINPIQTAHSSNTGLIVGLIAGGVVLLIVAIMFFVVISPKMQSRALAEAFMNNMTKGNVDKAVEQTGDTSTKTFLANASAKLKGEKSKLNKQQFSSSGESYYLFDLSGGDTKYARVTTDKENGKRVVSSFVFSAKELSLVPGNSSTKTTDSGDTDITATEPSSTSTCLAKSDFDTIVNANNGGNGSGSIDYSSQQDLISSYYNRPAYFLPDSLNFDTQDDYAGYNAEVMVKSFADFYKTNSDKEFTIKLEGVVATTAPADLAFGTQRSEKIKSMLVSNGVPADRIEVMKSTNISTYAGGAWAGSENDTIAKRLARSVALYIVPDVMCNSVPASSGTGR